MEEQAYEYDVALSFAGADREIAITIARIAEANGVNVFIDEQHLWEAWGKNLNDYLSDVYYNKSRYCLILISQEYCDKAYTNLERKIALDRVLESKEEYLLPMRIDDSWPTGLPRATAYLDLRVMSVEMASTILLQKIKGPGAVINMIPNAPEQKLIAMPAPPSAGSRKQPIEANDPILTFPSIQMRPESKYWKSVPATDGMATADLSWRTVEYDDPVFDITIMNSTDRPLLVTTVGIEVIRIRCDGIWIMGGEAAQTVPFHLTYKLSLPDLWNTLAEQLKAKGLERKDPVDIRERTFCRLPDPVMIEPYRPYRFGLHLFDYINFFPNDISLRFCVNTNAGEACSPTAQLQFLIGRTIAPLSRFWRLYGGATELESQERNALRYLQSDKETKLRELAYTLWEKAGKPQGQDATLWNEAEKELPLQLLAEDDLRMVKKRPF